MVSLTHLRFGKELEQLKISDIEHLIENKIDESQNLEYKEPTSDLQEDCNDLAKTISGFLNTDGGTIIYGVSETKEKDHRYPVSIKLCSINKERFESLLLSRVEPWEERIRIHRITNSANIQNGIFVLEVPKSVNPPHMSNFYYYHRHNYRTDPMSHQDVLRVFQTSWIERRELNQSVIQPLYSEIKENCLKLSKCEYGTSSHYSSMNQVNSYLYDRLESSLREKIDLFYNKMDKLNGMLMWKDGIATRIMNEQMVRTRSRFFSRKRLQIRSSMQEKLLQADVKMRYPDRNTSQVRHTLENALFPKPYADLRIYFQEIYSSREIVACEPVLAIPNQNSIKISEYEFDILWAECISEAEKNKNYISIKDETPKLLELGHEILVLTLTK